jgi:hypothetical protein
VISIPFKPDVVILKPPYALRIHLLGGMSVLIDTEYIEKEQEIILLATVPYSAFISKIEIVSGGYTLAAPVRWRPMRAERGAMIRIVMDHNPTKPAVYDIRSLHA